MDASLLKETEFAAIDRETWVKLAQKALKGADFAETLISKTDDNIAIEPLYDRRHKAKLAPRKSPSQPWHIVQRIDDPDPVRANRQLLAELESGATGISLVFEGAPNAFGYGLPSTREAVDKVLHGVHLDMIHLRMDVHPRSRACADWFVDYMRPRDVNPKTLSFSLGIDPAATLAGTGRLRMSVAALKASLPQSLSGFFSSDLPGIVLEADGRVYHNAGATEAQELGAMLSIAAGHFRLFEEARQPIVYAAPHIGFALSVDQDQFLSIAKVRAMRRLWTRLQEACGARPSRATIHAETSYRMMTKKDPETNILRTTIAGFAGAVGGADSIAILPHTIAHGLPDAFARRLARNTQLILAEESNLAFVADPACGSGAVESLTEKLCEAAWKEFQLLERDGGILQSLVDGKLQARVLEARHARTKEYSSGRRAIVGTTLFPAKQERPVSVLDAPHMPLPTDGVVHCEPLTFPRIDETLQAAE
ncbi:methylmalonyl-CoA mutase [Phyllobacterium brassicacearum]|uniref:Methylmalonyl-CoA mutase n=1 Tax=Phyllobacterium brassicacearum TaxID=314235 RepID=A0A2P7BVV1_9HYPH|nr:methylmalonyl-CoA mutase subunit beta [Phyllobacterium brassicacearum]PSH70598.1 methylmalonyl-CoA mutase [Phyllobacterium brassicacearum]TDQ35941.1 heterodimeric methylmalonyl-CoA mutase small subunit [Phyllobacterium brassicacearum]